MFIIKNVANNHMFLPIIQEEGLSIGDLDYSVKVYFYIWQFIIAIDITHACEEHSPKFSFVQIVQCDKRS